MMHVLLMGLRGSGKSTCGARLAAALGRRFVDLDDEVRRRMGTATVREAWDRFGEPAFRSEEIAALRDVLSEADEGLIVALGGGTPTVDGFDEESRGTLRVYLHAPADALRARLREGDQDRPALLGASAVDEIEEVYRARDGLYRELAHAVVDAGDGVEDTVSRVGDVVDQAASE